MIPPFLITFWKPIVHALVFGCLLITVKVQTERLRAVKAEYKGYVTQVEALGKNQIETNKRKHAADLQLKKGLDDENKKLRGDIAVAGKRLRDLSAGSGRMPEIPASTGGSDTITLSRADVNRALRDYFEGERRRDSETTGLIIEGAEAVVDLNTGKAWAKAHAANTGEDK